MNGSRTRVYALALALLVAAAPAGAKTVTLSLWSALGGSKMPANDWLIAAFEAAYPEITVEHTIISSPTELDEKMLVAVAGGVPPDLVCNHFYYAAKYAHKGVIYDLGSFMAKSGLKTEMFLPSVVEEGRYGGAQMALPIYSDTRILYYNKDMYVESGLNPAKPPETWGEFEAVSAKLVRIEGEKITRAAWDVGRGDTNLFLPRLWGWGGRFFDENGLPAFNSPAGVAAWQSWADLYYDHSFVPIEGGVRMASRTAAMTFNNPAAIVTMKDELPGVAWGVARMPAGPQARASWADSFQMWIPRGAGNADAAWVFVSFAMKRESQMNYNALCYRIPPLLTALRNNPFIADEYVAPFVHALELDSRPIPSTPVYRELWDALNAQLKAAMNRTTTVQEALNTAARQANQLIAALR
jgi:multiple sugar transport system substrate-binding protein